MLLCNQIGQDRERGCCCCCGLLELAIVVAQVEWVGNSLLCLPHEVCFKDYSPKDDAQITAVKPYKTEQFDVCFYVGVLDEAKKQLRHL